MIPPYFLLWFNIYLLSNTSQLYHGFSRNNGEYLSNFLYFFYISQDFRRVEYRRNTKNYENIHLYFFKNHDMTGKYYNWSRKFPFQQIRTDHFDDVWEFHHNTFTSLSEMFVSTWESYTTGCIVCNLNNVIMLLLKAKCKIIHHTITTLFCYVNCVPLSILKVLSQLL